jgi:hypothetical protein
MLSNRNIARSPDKEALARFFQSYNAGYRSQSRQMQNQRLNCFFNDFKQLNEPVIAVPSIVIEPIAVNGNRVTSFFGLFHRTLSKLRATGDLTDVWAIARIGRREIRNAAVLAWLLDPLGTHGFSERFFRNLVQALAKARVSGFPIPSDFEPTYRVRTEIYPIDGVNRVDIWVEGKDFVLVIEVKIDALEGYRQIERCKHAAKTRAGDRQYGILYISPTIHANSTNRSDRICFATWKDVAGALESSVNAKQYIYENVRDRIIGQFARHISRL